MSCSYFSKLIVVVVACRMNVAVWTVEPADPWRMSIVILCKQPYKTRIIRDELRVSERVACLAACLAEADFTREVVCDAITQIMNIP